VTLRKVPAALALGLLASILAHGGLYGGEHAMGGGYHALLLQAALASSVGLLVFYGLLAASGAKAAVNGSILAGRLIERLPGYGSLCIATAGWYGVAECLEPQHAAASLLAVPLWLVAAAWLVAFLSRRVVAVLAGAVFAAWRAGFSPRTPAWLGRLRSPRPTRRILWTRRRFARPPPIGLDYCA
jgi:hypothetical protein